jgi:hypothetical protein
MKKGGCFLILSITDLTRVRYIDLMPDMKIICMFDMHQGDDSTYLFLTEGFAQGS